jgi:hypothetical protein
MKETAVYSFMEMTLHFLLTGFSNSRLTSTNESYREPGLLATTTNMHRYPMTHTWSILT